MRFPAKDVVFDETKPLGCGNYGYVFNGLVKVGFARSVEAGMRDG